MRRWSGLSGAEGGALRPGSLVPKEDVAAPFWKAPSHFSHSLLGVAAGSPQPHGESEHREAVLLSSPPKAHGSGHAVSDLRGPHQAPNKEGSGSLWKQGALGPLADSSPLSHQRARGSLGGALCTHSRRP